MSASDFTVEQQHQTQAAETADLIPTESNIQALQHGISNLTNETTGFRIFTYKEIQDATNGLTNESKIGQGGFGSVYKGSLADNTEVAIKVLAAESEQGPNEFEKELRILGNIRHPHLVRLLGACLKPRSLVYEYAANGSLHDCLDKRPEVLSWRKRTNIILELCSALRFLHSQKPERIVHKDVKPQNVLLDANYSVKLGDFGLSSYIPQGPGGATVANHVTENFQGTQGFMDPDYLEHGQIGPRCDVYAFGITILIILTRLPPLDIVWRVHRACHRKNMMAIVDPAAGKWPAYVAEYLARIGIECCEQERKCSTLMENISSGLEDILRKFHKVRIDSVHTVLVEVSNYLGDGGNSEEIVGIYGPCGIGKTTILKHINNSLAADSRFHHVLLVVASRGCTTEKIQRSIVEQLKLKKKNDNVEAQAHIIHDFLCEKNFVLLLDDVWEFVDLEAVGIPRPLGSSKDYRRKVVLTTRSETVCREMQTHKRIRMGFLNLEDARSLFLENVGEPTLNCNPIIRGLAEAVIAECGGLPLALVMIGKVMSSMTTPEAWMRVIMLLQNNQFPQDTDENLFSKLTLSFDYLKGDRERECFLCCALWPEDFNVQKVDLINCWMGHGLLDDSVDIYLKGDSIIGDLQASCLLESGDGDDYVKMHDVVRDMALWIVSQRGDKWVVRAGLWLREVPGDTHDWRGAQRISLAYNEIRSLPSPLGMDSPNLSTLMLQSNHLDVRNWSWACYSNLKYLDLSSNNKRYVYGSISTSLISMCECMKNLQYLDLSNLNLQIHFDDLPPFPNLKYLLLRNNEVIAQRQPSIPPKLSVLDLFNFDYPYKLHGMIIDGLCHHKQVSHTKWLSLLGVHVKSVEELRKASTLNIGRSLAIRGMEGHSSLNLADPHGLGNDYSKYRLNELHISRCQDLVELLVSGSPLTTLASLRSLSLFVIRSLKKITFKGLMAPANFFPSLREITISSCDELSHVSCVLLLPCLERLDLVDCDKMEYVIIGSHVKMEDREKNAFPRLKRLMLFGMRSLLGICDYPLTVPPSLEFFGVGHDCNMRKFPFKVPSSTDGASSSNVREIRATQKWWDNLIWDGDDDTRDYFQKFLNLW